MANRPWLKLRRKLFKKARRNHQGRPLRWIGGILYLADVNLPVPGIRHVPKYGKPVLGLSAHSSAMHDEIHNHANAGE